MSITAKKYINKKPVKRMVVNIEKKAETREDGLLMRSIADEGT